jgi:two-component system cell cycle sensor histidine kinase/response regulator CckA
VLNGPDPGEQKRARTDNGVPRVLVVDDEQSILTFAQRVLSDAGYQVAAALNGPEALELVDKQSPFDLFVIDIVMPGMGGPVLAQTLLQRFPKAKVLYFTGQSDHLLEGRRVLYEREAFVDKPVTMNGLLEAVSMSLFGHTHGLAR